MGNLNKYFGYIITLVCFPLWIYYGFQLWIFYCQTLQHWLGEVIGFIASIIFIPGLILFPFFMWFIEGVFPTLYFQLFLYQVLCTWGLGFGVYRILAEMND